MSWLSLRRLSGPDVAARKLFAELGGADSGELTIADLLQAVGAVVCRPVILEREAEPLPGMCGEVTFYSDRAVIRIGPTVSEAHFRWIVLHECGHVLCGHAGEEVSEIAAQSDRFEPALVDRVLSVHYKGEGFRSRDERQAERFALLAHEWLALRVGGPDDAAAHEALG